MSVDVDEVSQFLLISTQLWSIPFRMVVILILLWQYLGFACLATVVVMFGGTLITTFVVRICDKLQVCALLALSLVKHEICFIAVECMPFSPYCMF